MNFIMIGLLLREALDRLSVRLNICILLELFSARLCNCVHYREKIQLQMWWYTWNKKGRCASCVILSAKFMSCPRGLHPWTPSQTSSTMSPNLCILARATHALLSVDLSGWKLSCRCSRKSCRPSILLLFFVEYALSVGLFAFCSSFFRLPSTKQREAALVHLQQQQASAKCYYYPNIKIWKILGICKWAFFGKILLSRECLC